MKVEVQTSQLQNPQHRQSRRRSTKMGQIHTVDGSEIWRSPVEVGKYPMIYDGFHTCWLVVWNFWTINSIRPTTLFVKRVNDPLPCDHWKVIIATKTLNNQEFCTLYIILLGVAGIRRLPSHESICHTCQVSAILPNIRVICINIPKPPQKNIKYLSIMSEYQHISYP